MFTAVQPVGIIMNRCKTGYQHATQAVWMSVWACTFGH